MFFVSSMAIPGFVCCKLLKGGEPLRESHVCACGQGLGTVDGGKGDGAVWTINSCSKKGEDEFGGDYLRRPNASDASASLLSLPYRPKLSVVCCTGEEAVPGGAASGNKPSLQLL